MDRGKSGRFTPLSSSLWAISWAKLIIMKFPTISVPFALGQTVATPHVLKVVPKAEIFAALQRHQNCDWGDVCPQDKWANDRAVKGGERLLSVYHSKDGVNRSRYVSRWRHTGPRFPFGSP